MRAPSLGGVGEFLLQMVVGTAVGLAGGWLLGLLMRRVRLPNESLYPLRTIAFAALIYGVGTVLQGSGFLAVFLAGIVVGDIEAPYQQEVRRFSSGLSSLAEIIAFTVLGLTVSWSDVLTPAVLVPGLVLSVLLIVVIRPLLVGALLLPIRLALGERAFIVLAGLKGAVPILLGILIRDADVPGGQQLADLIFVVVLVSVVVQGSARAAARRVVQGADAHRRAAALRRGPALQQQAAGDAALRRLDRLPGGRRRGRRALARRGGLGEHGAPRGRRRPV